MPLTAAGAPTLTALSAGACYTCGLADDGSGYCWGLNDFGQLGDGTRTSSATPQRVVGGLTFKQLDAGWRGSAPA